MHIIHNKSKVAYEQVGKGQNLILLHGFCEDSTMWADFAPLLSKKYSILTIDLSGFGKSDLLEEHSIDAMADAVHTVLDHLSIKTCVLIGHSMGGYVGLSFSERYPDRLSGLGLFHSHPYLDSEIKIKNRLKTIRFIKRHGIAPFAGAFVRDLFTDTFVNSNMAFIEDFIHKTSMQHSDAVIAASYAMINRDNKANVLSNLDCPTLFIVGEQDRAISKEHSFEQLSLGKIASVHIFKDAGHMAMFESPLKSLEVIADFMDFCKQKQSADLVGLSY